SGELCCEDLVLAPADEGGAATLRARSGARDPLLKCAQKIGEIGRDGVILSLPGTHLFGEILIEFGRARLIAWKLGAVADPAAEIAEALLARELGLPPPVGERLIGREVSVGEELMDVRPRRPAGFLSEFGEPS